MIFILYLSTILWEINFIWIHRRLFIDLKILFWFQFNNDRMFLATWVLNHRMGLLKLRGGGSWYMILVAFLPPKRNMGTNSFWQVFAGSEILIFASGLLTDQSWFFVKVYSHITSNFAFVFPFLKVQHYYFCNRTYSWHLLHKQKTTLRVNKA